MTNKLVSVVIPTYNRFNYLLNTIKSIKNQTYRNLEILVVNDCSTQSQYYNFDWGKLDIKIIHLKENTKKIFGYACAAYVRNEGIKQSSGKYIAFCDDDDVWFPEKIEKQITAMKETSCKMSSTEGFIGNGMYKPGKKYSKYLSQRYIVFLKNIYTRNGININKGFPKIWNYNFLKIHNCMITSSVVIEKSILDKINNFKNMKPPGEDYDCWLRALKHTNSVYVDTPLFYYDLNHGDGQNY